MESKLTFLASSNLPSNQESIPPTGVRRPRRINWLGIAITPPLDGSIAAIFTALDACESRENRYGILSMFHPSRSDRSVST